MVGNPVDQLIGVERYGEAYVPSLLLDVPELFLREEMFVLVVEDWMGKG
jgi:hypothetical protein